MYDIVSFNFVPFPPRSSLPSLFLNWLGIALQHFCIFVSFLLFIFFFNVYSIIVYLYVLLLLCFLPFYLNVPHQECPILPTHIIRRTTTTLRQ
mmetsp:Transcript_1633/g.3343  ORF Transcript_1633/g.3343 Transcript_1633/m.3343 type:complete len:93 (-) Transcript_1633:25-303(-)